MSSQRNIGIITYSRAYNYGSSLQSYALNKYLRTQGFNVRTIDYSNEAQVRMYEIFEPWSGIMSVARNVHSFLNFRKLKSHISNFESFLKSHVPMTHPMCKPEALTALNPDFDYFICGSDQIWNVECDDFDNSYMLAFVNDKNKCIAYAPSLGKGSLNPKTSDAIRKYATEFRSLSSREADSAPIIAAATNSEVTTVCDPVFLLSANEWADIASSIKLPKEYILGYFIGDVAGMRDFAAKLGKSTKLPVIVICKNLRDLKYRFKNRYDSGPAEFVSLIKNASGIVTNSFHAISFSLIFKKQFWGFIPQSADSRISGLLNMMTLNDRLLTSQSASGIDHLGGIDYSTVDFSKLNSLIANSKLYLQNACHI
ncbi:MAG: polysaccharide pyruvyl transferase family protein [Bacteroides sp.]|nr:polysaccharide pyruvyl transferase family protein [Bacteroides sp.]MCM1378735.1 polysaccharide pyruvyl transferase family protein [Bacteroides sp.]MCM1445352.1 polysaccharide pyruvyl transferase family protein [Prevotella sp.]